MHMLATISLAAATLAGAAAHPARDPASAERDLTRYAMATCLAAQDQPYLKDQGRRWAGGLIERGHGPIEAWTPVTEAVAAELARSGMGVSKPDGPFNPSVPMPLMTCGHIADAPTVRAAIDTATKALAADYAAQPKE